MGAALRHVLRARKRPSLDLNFLNGVADSRITFSGGANGTRVDASGNIVAATAPRFDYDPVSRAPKGLLIEEARTNSALSSEDFRTAAEGNPVTAWNENGGVPAEQDVAKNVTGPDGVANSGTTITWSGATAGNTRWQQAAKTSGATATNSIFLKQGSTQYTSVQSFFSGGTNKDSYAVVDWTAGTVAVAGGDAANATATITAYANGWYRVSIVHVDTGANTIGRISVAPTQSNGTTVITGTVIAFGADIEAGSFATSYIPTTTAAVQRTADSAVMTGANFTQWYRQDAGTFVVDAVSPYAVHPAGTQAGVFLVSDGAMNNTIAVLKGSGTSDYAYAVTVGGVQQAAVTTLASSTAGQLVKHAVAYRANDFAGSANGGTPATDAAGTLPTVDRMHIGQSNTAGWWFNGHIRTLKFYPKRFPDSTLQRMTAS